MNQPIHPQSRVARARQFAIVVLSLVCLLAYSMLERGIAPPISFSLKDKLEHFIVYGGLGLLTYQIFEPQLKQGHYRWLLAFLAISLFGGIDELLQHFNPSRTGDPLDWFADSVGALVGIFLFRNLSLLRRITKLSITSLLPRAN